MDCRQWPLNRIMQLPDWCFGTKFVVSCYALSQNQVDVFDIAETKFPDVGVIWQLQIITNYSDDVTNIVRLKLAEHLPATFAAFDHLPPLIRNFGGLVLGDRALYQMHAGHQINMQLRMPVYFQGRRLCMCATAGAAKTIQVTAFVVVSSLPTEVPDWLISDRDKNQL